MDASRGTEATADSSTTVTLTSRAVPASDQLFERILAADESPLAYWESPSGDRLAGVGAAATIREPGFDQIVRKADQHFTTLEYTGPPEARPRMIGGRSFTENTRGPPWATFPSGYFFLPRHLVVAQDDSTYHTVTAAPGEVDDAIDEVEGRIPTEEREPLTITDTEPYPSRAAWNTSVTKVGDRIATGRIKKAVLAHSLAVSLNRPPRAEEAVERLRRLNPGCFINLIRPRSQAMFLAATPERLVSREGTAISTAALAGSMRRGESDEDDDRLSNALQSDGKESHEHALVVDSIEADLQSLGAVVAIKDRCVKRLRSVQHLYTPIEATHDDPPHVLEAVDALHPTPAVGGLPRDDALALIEEIETFDRGWYASPYGWFDENGDGSFTVGIRSGLIDGEQGHVFAGAGIVDGSEPADEWEEVQWKYRPMLDALHDQ